MHGQTTVFDSRLHRVGYPNQQGSQLITAPGKGNHALFWKVVPNENAGKIFTLTGSREGNSARRGKRATTISELTIVDFDGARAAQIVVVPAIPAIAIGHQRHARGTRSCIVELVNCG